MKNTPVDYQTARRIIDGFGLPDFGKATIREVVCHIHAIGTRNGNRVHPYGNGRTGLESRSSRRRR